MKSILRKSKTPRGLFAAVSLFAVAIFGISFASQVQAETQRPRSGERLITVHDQGEEKSFLTRATTLRKALQAADIPVDTNDLVEPGLDNELIASAYEVNIYRARPVTIIDGTTRQKVMSPYRTAKQVVAQAGMTLQDEDETTMTVNADLVGDGSGVQLAIDRATSFKLNLYGKSITAYTQAETVEQMLDEKGITLAANDTISVSREKPIVKGMTVEIWRNGKQTTTVDEAIAPPVRQIQDADQPVGYKKVQTPGEPGQKAVTYEIIMKNGKQVSRKVIQSVVTKQPKERVEVVGTKMTNTFNGTFAEALARLRSCEGSYTSNTGNGYYGAYQFDVGTWGGYGGYAVASDAPPAVQDEKAWETYQRRGWQPWPSCSNSMGLQDIYR